MDGYRKIINAFNNMNYIYLDNVDINDFGELVHTYVVPAFLKGKAIRVSLDSSLDIWIFVAGSNTDIKPQKFEIYLGNKKGYELFDNTLIEIYLTDISYGVAKPLHYKYQDIKPGFVFPESFGLHKNQGIELKIDDEKHITIDDIQFKGNVDMFVYRDDVKSFCEKYSHFKLKYLEKFGEKLLERERS